jgi:5-methylcytosine-specific restriction endonuclease McrA
MSKTCGVCGISIPSHKKFCSKSCYGKSLSDKLQRNCKICEKKFETTPSKDQKYCSKKCAGIARTTSKEIDCENCNKTITKEPNEIKRSENNFCSPKCHNEHQRNMKECNECGAEYYGGGKNREFCSTKCFGKSKRVKKIEKECPECNEISLVYPHYSKKHDNVFCSSSCRSDWLEKNSLFATDNPNYKDGKYNGFGSNWHKKREEALERDNYVCQNCSKTKEENGRSLSVHHIKPRSEFIQNENTEVEESNKLSNLVTLCRGCHMKAEHNNIKFNGS